VEGNPRSEGERRPARSAILLDWATGPVRRMWHSHVPLEAYALVQLASAAGDAVVAIALADSVFFSVPVGQAKVKVALYLLLTMAPLAVAAPALVPLLDRWGHLRTIAFAAAAGRAAVAIYAAPRFDSLLLFPLAFVLLVLSKVNGVTKNGLTMAYAPRGEGLVVANARLSRLNVIGGLLVVGPGVALLKLGGAEPVVNLAAAAYVVTMLLTLRLHPPKAGRVGGEVTNLGAIPGLTVAAAGTAALKAGGGFLFFLLAFALRGGRQPAYWFGVLAIAAAAGGFLGDVVAPRLSRFLREEAAVFTSLLAAGVVALFATAAFQLAILALFAGFAGMATEFGRLSFQSLMQRLAPDGAHGRVFVRYDMAFQLAWVAGAFVPAVFSFSFRTGVGIMAVFYLVLGVAYSTRPVLFRRLFERPAPG
jgi:hypothetical protein